jgi:hypothetical protein
MSWDKPVMEETLEYLNSMISSWEKQLILNGNLQEHWFGNSKRAEALGLIMAYKSVREHIEKEIEFRASLALKEGKNLSQTKGGKK